MAFSDLDDFLSRRENESHSVVSNTLRPQGLYSLWNSPGQNTGVGSLSLLQGIFATQGSNPGLPHCRQILYQLSHEVSPRILEWVACPFSRGSSRPRNWTGVTCTAGGFFTNWASIPANMSKLRWGQLGPRILYLAHLRWSLHPLRGRWVRKVAPNLTENLVSSSQGWREREIPATSS